MTTQFTATASLRKGQYKDSTKLSARANLHQLFSTNPTEWHEWVFNQFQFPDEPKILEIGSGPGYLWQKNENRLSQANIFLSDISIGMLKEARTYLANNKGLRFSVLDACSIPFPEGFFDAVIANHMLYHIPDVPSALKEIGRVLHAGGCLYASTNGSKHLIEIRDWKTQFFPDRDSPGWGTPALSFSLENGEDLLGHVFKDIQFTNYPDSLKVDQVEPIIRYIESYDPVEEQHPGTGLLREYLHQQIDENGSITITKESGLFTAIKR